MNFFDYIKNESFFKPLTSKYRRIYYDCIQILIDKTKELPVLYETEENGKELQPGVILALFRSCGWLLPREIGRSGEYVTNIATDCRRFMDFLRKMAEKTGIYSNAVYGGCWM